MSGSSRAVRWRDWKLIRTPRERGLELYDLGADPDERHNVAGLHPAIARNLEADLEAWRSGQSARPASDGPLPDDVSEALRALGYVE